MEYHILNDQDLSFQDIMRRHLSGESMVNVKEKKLWDEMRSNAAAARKELEKDKKDDVKESKDEKHKTDEGDTNTESKEEENDALSVEENKNGESKNDEVKEDSKEQEDEKDQSEPKDPTDDDKKDISEEQIDECKADTKTETEPDKEKTLQLKKKKMKGKLKKGKKRGPGRPPKNSEKENPFVEDDLEDMHLGDVDDDGAPVLPKDLSEKPIKRKPGRPPGRPKKQVDASQISAEIEGKRSTRSDMKGVPFEGSPSKGSVSLTPVKKSSDQNSPPRRKGGFANVSIEPPQISLQQMEQMARGGVYDMDMMTDLMQQTYAAAIKWPKDRILTIRLEHIMEAVETDKWPVSIDFSYAEAAQLTIPESPTPVEGAPITPMKETPSSATSEVSEVSNPYEDSNILTPGRKHGNRGRKPLGVGPSLHSPEMIDKSSKIRSLLTAGHHVGRHNQRENEDIR